MGRRRQNLCEWPEPCGLSWAATSPQPALPPSVPVSVVLPDSIKQQNKSTVDGHANNPQDMHASSPGNRKKGQQTLCRR